MRMRSWAGMWGSKAPSPPTSSPHKVSFSPRKLATIPWLIQSFSPTDCSANANCTAGYSSQRVYMKLNNNHLYCIEVLSWIPSQNYWYWYCLPDSLEIWLARPRSRQKLKGRNITCILFILLRNGWMNIITYTRGWSQEYNQEISYTEEHIAVYK